MYETSIAVNQLVSRMLFDKIQIYGHPYYAHYLHLQ